MLRDYRVEAVSNNALPVVQVISREVFTVGDDFEERLWVYASLKADDEVVDILGEVEGIFSGSLLTTAPARVLERCD